jgi:hypothetical protein
MKHRGEQEEIILTDQRNFEIGIAAFFELERAYKPPKPPPRMRTRVLFMGILSFALSLFERAVRFFAFSGRTPKDLFEVIVF